MVAGFLATWYQNNRNHDLTRMDVIEKDLESLLATVNKNQLYLMERQNLHSSRQQTAEVESLRLKRRLDSHDEHFKDVETLANVRHEHNDAKLNLTRATMDNVLDATRDTMIERIDLAREVIVGFGGDVAELRHAVVTLAQMTEERDILMADVRSRVHGFGGLEDRVQKFDNLVFEAGVVVNDHTNRLAVLEERLKGKQDAGLTQETERQDADKREYVGEPSTPTGGTVQKYVRRQGTENNSMQPTADIDARIATLARVEGNRAILEEEVCCAIERLMRTAAECDQLARQDALVVRRDPGGVRQSGNSGRGNSVAASPGKSSEDGAGRSSAGEADINSEDEAGRNSEDVGMPAAAASDGGGSEKKNLDEAGRSRSVAGSPLAAQQALNGRFELLGQRLRGVQRGFRRAVAQYETPPGPSPA
jgi:hypothetical protein